MDTEKALKTALVVWQVYGNFNMLSADAAKSLAVLFAERAAKGEGGTEIRNGVRLPIED